MAQSGHVIRATSFCPAGFTPDGSSVHGLLEWRKGAGYAAFITDVAADSALHSRDIVVAHDVPAGLRALAKLIASYEAEKVSARKA